MPVYCVSVIVIDIAQEHVRDNRICSHRVYNPHGMTLLIHGRPDVEDVQCGSTKYEQGRFGEVTSRADPATIRTQVSDNYEYSDSIRGDGSPASKTEHKVDRVYSAAHVELSSLIEEPFGFELFRLWERFRISRHSP